MQELIIGGTYQHYQGGIAKVICVAKHTETLEDLVVYSYVYPKNDTKHDFQYPFRARPKTAFLEDVEWQGIMVPRFKLLEGEGERRNVIIS